MLSRRLAAVAGLVLAMGATTVTTAAAAPDPKPTTGVGECAFVEICVGAGVGSSGGSDDDKAAAPSKGSNKPSVPGPCTVTKMDPQPPVGSTAWEGHSPDEGAIYTRICPLAAAAAGITGLMGPPQTFWAAAPPVAVVDPAQLAQQALDKMTLLGPDIQITPKPGGKGVVGMPVWMWTTESAETYGPNSASASAGGITVTATAKVKRIVWDMGDGTTVTCTTAGTPYKAEFGKKDSPDCGTRYSDPSSTQPGGRYHVSATSTWQVDWQVNGGGETGQLAATRNNAVDINIAEVQVLN
ncbi:ATP/GTP-binding protein [Streptomyces phaeochromogenes]